MYKKSQNTISGTLSFSQRKILLKAGDISYYVRLARVQKDYLHGDRVRARITKKSDGGQLAEVEILSLEKRTEEMLLARVITKNGKRWISVIRELGFYETHLISIPFEIHDEDILLVRFSSLARLVILSKFSGTDDFDHEERILFFLSGTRMDFPKGVETEAQRLQGEKETILKYTFPRRRDFRQSFIFTIDGADAKDLDDAISIEKDKDGNYLLGVHIADVAEYVREYSQLDKEALTRATSIYTPGKVIPMLPEALSNDVCSLHPGEPKLVLSCLMTVDIHGYVKKTELVEGIIESAHRGVYEDIQKNYEGVKGKDDSNLSGLVGGNLSKKFSTKKNKREEFLSGDGGQNIVRQIEDGASFFSTNSFIGQVGTEGTIFTTKSTDPISIARNIAITLSYELYEILKKRRKKEGKILFESTEAVFGFGSEQKGVVIPESIHARTRVGAHMLIEEFMVLANEEVAKWCESHGLPFLSRVHGLPPYNSMEAIRQIITLSHRAEGGSILSRKNKQDLGHIRNDGNSKNSQKTLEPRHIREFLDTLDEDELYKYSRLLLPKMAKATYTDTKHRHFGLALEYYSHFTSPIRRYPDLQVHRIIKEKLRGTLTDERIIHYKKILKKVARLCSERERAAEDIERAFDSLYACRYMSKYVGETYVGRVSGIAEFAYFVELGSGVEVTVYLPRERRYTVDTVRGILTTMHNKRVVEIGEQLRVQIVGVMKDERRIVGEVA